jgi:hypothetical protein
MLPRNLSILGSGGGGRGVSAETVDYLTRTGPTYLTLLHIMYVTMNGKIEYNYQNM